MTFAGRQTSLPSSAATKMRRSSSLDRSSWNEGVRASCVDACSHGFGYESDECRTVLAAQDEEAARVIEAFAAKVGQGRYLVTLTADHGGTPLAELSGGRGIKAEPLRAELNARFDKLDNGVELFYDMLASQFYVNEAEMQRNGLDWEDLRQALLRDGDGPHPPGREGIDAVSSRLVRHGEGDVGPPDRAVLHDHVRARDRRAGVGARDRPLQGASPFEGELEAFHPRVAQGGHVGRCSPGPGGP